jgi:hypothetical protein
MRGTVVWVPVLPADAVEAAMAQAAAWHDPRVIHLWDGTGEVNAPFAQSLSLTGAGWDLYLVYAQGVRWEEDLPPQPTFWMHQLSPSVGADPSLRLSLDPSRMGAVLDDLLADHP